MNCQWIKCDNSNLYRCQNCSRAPVEIFMFPVELECTGSYAPCKKLGLQVSQHECSQCGRGKVTPLMDCGVFGICTVNSPVNETPCCRQCQHYDPL